jgi:hypothetical protein
MPVLVRAFGRKAVNCLDAPAFVAAIAQLPAMSAQAIAQLTLRRGHARPRLVVMHGKLLDDLTRTRLGSATRLANGTFEGSAQVA